MTTSDRRRCPDFAEILRSSPPDAALSEQIVACFSSEMLRAAHHRCRDATLAEDAFHEAVRITLENLPRYRGDAALTTWLYRIVTTACSRLRRGRKNDPAYNLPLDQMPPEKAAGT